MDDASPLPPTVHKWEEVETKSTILHIPPTQLSYQQGLVVTPLLMASKNN